MWKILAYVPALLYVVGMFVLSSMPEPPVVPELHFAFADKVCHGLGFVVGAVCFFVPTAVRRRSLGPAVAIETFAICIVLAVSDELHQYFVPGRDAEILDVLADAMGAGLGVGLASLVAWLALGPKRQAEKG